MKKSIVRSISKTPKMSEYILTKDTTLTENLTKFFINLGFDETKFDLEYFLITESSQTKEPKKKPFSIYDHEDCRYNLKDKNLDIDLFIGVEKVILVIRTPKDRQEEVSNKLFKVAKLVGE